MCGGAHCCHEYYSSDSVCMKVSCSVARWFVLWNHPISFKYPPEVGAALILVDTILTYLSEGP